MAKKSAQQRLKEIIEEYGHGLPSCADSIHQCDWWQLDATSIFSDICEAFDLWKKDEEE